jgi:ligand-binding sensor domain-containing protein
LCAIGGIVAFDGTEFTVIDPEEAGHRDAGYPDSVVIDRDGTVWVAGRRTVLSYDGSTWSVDEAPGGLDVHEIWSIVAGDDGSVWISTWAGVARYGPPPG